MIRMIISCLTAAMMSGVALASATNNVETPHGHQSTRIIRTPHSDDPDSQYFLIRAIELTDSATVVKYSFIHRPNYWCRLTGMKLIGNQTKRAYSLIKADGYTLGKKVYMPSTGRYDLSLTFPPIDPADTSVDMVEIENDGSKTVTVRNIHLSEDVGNYKFTTHLSGKYEGESGYVGVMKTGLSSNSGIKWIPVDDGKFDYVMHSDEPLVYDIINGQNYFRGTWNSGRFFSENASISFDFKPSEDSDIYDVPHHDITVNAPEGSLTEYLKKLDNSLSEHYDNSPAVLYRNSLDKERKFFVPEYYILEEIVKQHPEKRDSLADVFNKKYENVSITTPEGDRAEKAVKEYWKTDRVRFLCDQAVKADNLAGLFLLVNGSYYNRDNALFIEAYMKGYLGKFPESSYSAYMQRIAGTNEIAPGTQFNDFSACDVDGNFHTLSTLIKGKPALLDLWASWCGPCRKTSKSMIPVYEEFSSKGFTIIGVAREFGDSKAALKAIEKDGYRWLNLFEIDDSHGIWALYRRQNSAGGTFLISPEGKIVKTDVTAEDVRSYLKTLYPDK